ncbi:MAG: twin-arginine translocation pathway signal [Salinarimonadaceae bacterium]|nr:MAG: twin-arginine translocation pathway signal [Salinarimonadaceae bacterium]
MSLTRRGVLAFGGTAVAATLLGGSSRAQTRGVTPISPRVDRLPWFYARDHSARRFGALTFRSGVEINDPYPFFGGFSGLWRSPDGGSLLAVSDNGDWFSADIRDDGEGISGLDSAAMAPMLDARGRPLGMTEHFDVEALDVADGVAYVAIERTNALMRFDLREGGITVRGEELPAPPEMRTWARNKGPEGLAVAPPASPVAGALVVIAERSRPGADSPTQGVIVEGDRHGVFEVARSEWFDITDIEFLENGDLLLLERRYRIFRDIGARVRRIPGETIRPGALLDGPVIFEAGARHQIDNMEGLASHRAASGELVLTMISDDNFSILQRTLLLEFVLDGA